MKGSILSVASTSSQGVILGDDGVQYSFTPFGWRDSTVSAAPGMVVDFEIRGSHAVGIYSIPGQTPLVQPPSAGPATPSPVAPQQPVQSPPSGPATPGPVMTQQPVQPPPSGPAAPPATPSSPSQPPPAVPTGTGTSQQPYTPIQPQSHGSLGAALGWLFLIDVLCAILTVLIGWIPFIGWVAAFVLLFVPGFVGGRKADTLKNAMLAVLILGGVYLAVTFIVIYSLLELLQSLPIVGILVDSILGLVGGEGLVALAALALLWVILTDVLPLLVGALLGSLTKPKGN